MKSHTGFTLGRWIAASAALALAVGCGKTPQEMEEHPATAELLKLHEELQAEEGAVLARYTQLGVRKDKNEVTYQIPIDRAMALVAEEGVQPFDVEPPPPPPGAADFAEAEARAAQMRAEPVPAFEADSARVAQGKTLFTAKTCAACHSVDGSKRVGPSMKGLWGRVSVMADASVIRSDADYFKRSIKAPTEQVVHGYPPAMPTLQLTDAEIEAVMHYVFTL
ncbi:MAG: c-type cytochrome [Bradymonadia bacterium]